MKTRVLGLALLLPLLAGTLRAQVVQDGTNAVTGQVISGYSGYNPIMTAVPFLQLSPDARSSALGDQGVATSADIYSQHYNAAKYPFTTEDWGVSLSYSPWLSSLVSDMNLATLTGMYKITEFDVISASLSYFSMGKIKFSDRYGNRIGNFTPSELSFDVAYSRKLIDVLAIAVTGRFIYSDLTRKQNIGNTEIKPGYAGAVDIGLFYDQTFDLGSKSRGTVTAGLSFTNIGNKISYSYDLTSAADKNFLPAAMRIGAGFNFEFDEHNSLGAYLEACKLMVPTSPVYEGDSIVAGKDNGVNVMKGLFRSFNDAPGGAKEEFNEVMWSVGLEYLWSKMLSVRAGYFYEHQTKGSRQYVSLGVGIQYKMIGLDFSYLVPTSGGVSNNPLKNTLRVGVRVFFNKKNAHPVGESDETENETK